MKKWLGHGNSVVLSLAAVGIFILLTLFLRSIGGFQLDLTANKQYTLSEQTQSVLKSIRQDVRILSFTVGSAQNQVLNQDVSDLLEEYKKRSSKLSVEEYELNQEPALARQYGVSSASIVLLQGDQSRVVDIGTLFRATADGNGYEFAGEEQLTSSLMSLSSSDTHKIAFLSGHEEIPLSEMTGLHSSLEQYNATATELQLNRDGAIPEDTDVLAIIGPQRDLSDQELKLIREYLSNGGKLLLALGFKDDMAESWSNIDALASDYGVKDLHAVTVDRTQTSTLGPLWVVPSLGEHPITSKLASANLLPMLSLSIALTTSEEEQSNWQLTSLMQSSGDSYGELDIKGLLNGDTSFNEGTDIQGPVNLGYAADTAEGKSKAIILGSSALFSDTEWMNGGNRDLALNSYNHLLERSNDLSIRPRQQQGYELAYLTPVQARTILAITVVGIPLVLIAGGALLWWRRRQS
ncbi:GldG family protein [Paenibacillus sp. FSL K6-1230]|uniref:GldG family protein n=1 Tax=Paenibacillus sp. FSL K6-1230 TaxID=2921603 RepID=UPI0030F9C4BF